MILLIRHDLVDLELATGLTIDTVIADCEGCWHQILANYPDKLRNVKTLILGKALYLSLQQLWSHEHRNELIWSQCNEG